MMNALLSYQSLLSFHSCFGRKEPSPEPEESEEEEEEESEEEEEVDEEETDILPMCCSRVACDASFFPSPAFALITDYLSLTKFASCRRRTQMRKWRESQSPKERGEIETWCTLKQSFGCMMYFERKNSHGFTLQGCGSG